MRTAWIPECKADGLAAVARIMPTPLITWSELFGASKLLPSFTMWGSFSIRIAGLGEVSQGYVLLYLDTLLHFSILSFIPLITITCMFLLYKLLAMPTTWVARMLTSPTFSIGLSLLGALPPNPLFTQQHCHFKYILLILILSFILPYFYYILTNSQLQTLIFFVYTTQF